MKKTIIISLLFFNILSLSAQKASLTKLYADNTKSSITYYMSHPLHSWTGQSEDVNAVILFDKNKSKIIQSAVSVKISSFDSKNANRDSHTMEVTNALKYPNVTFISKSIIAKKNNYQVNGLLTFHGITKKISFSVVVNSTKKEIEVSGKFSIKMTDFGIKPPSLMGMATKDEIKISFNVFFRKDK